MSRSGPPLSARLHVLGAVTLASLIATGWPLVLVVGATIALIARHRPEVVRALARPIFLVFTLISVGVGAILFGPTTPSVLGAYLGLEIVFRAAAILVVARWIAADASPFEFAPLFHRFGLRWVGFALGIALNALPILERSARRTWDAMRMRGGLRHHRLRSLRLIFIATLTHALHHADAQADAATARGFRLDLPPEPPPKWHRNERALVAASWLSAIVVTFLTWRG